MSTAVLNAIFVLGFVALLLEFLARYAAPWIKDQIDARRAAADELYSWQEGVARRLDENAARIAEVDLGLATQRAIAKDLAADRDKIFELLRTQDDINVKSSEVTKSLQTVFEVFEKSTRGLADASKVDVEINRDRNRIKDLEQRVDAIARARKAKP